MTDLRERRRVETFKQIQQVALRLAAEHGFDAVTVEAICAEAGISPRTFFNYFPVKDAAFVIGPPPFTPEAIERFLRRPGSLFDDLVVLMESRMPVSADAKRVMRLMHEVSRQHPKVLALQLGAFHAHEAEVADLISLRLEYAQGDVKSKVLAAAMLSAARVILSKWAASEDSEEKGQGPDLHAGLEPLRTLLVE